MKMLKYSFAALVIAAVAPVFAADEVAADLEVEEEGVAIGWTPVAFGIASPVQLPWGRAKWDVFGLDLNIIYADAPKMYGLGIGGIAMACRDTMAGMQISALCNWNNADVKGMRVTCGGNFCYGTTYGVDVGCFAIRNDMWGWDTEFVGSYQDNFWGVQIGGIANVSKVQSYGAEIAIGCNWSVEKAYGLQLAGLFNYANELHGCQIGCVNYAQECPWGFQIGIVNIIMDNSCKVLPIVNGYF